jgi:hypothetical protein
MVDWFAPGYKAGGPIQSCVNVAFALKDIIVYWSLHRILTMETSSYPGIITNY